MSSFRAALLRNAAVAAAAITMASLAQAQETWYRVDIVLFSQVDYSPETATIQREQMPADVELSWPANLIELNSEEREELLALELEQQELEAGGNFAQFNSPIQTNPVPEVAPPFQSPYGTPLPFYEIPGGEIALQREANTLNRTGSYEVLWHQSWMQPTRSINRTPWVLVKGGEEFDGRYQLEGAVQIYESRFVHVEVDLWLTEFMLADFTYDGVLALPEYPETELPCDWLKANWGEPLVPMDSDRDYFGCILPPPAEPVLEEELLAAEEQPDLYADQNSFSQFPVIEESEPEVTAPVTDASAAAELEVEQIDGLGPEFSVDRLEHLDPLPSYVPASVIHFKDDKRLQTGELHYVDHPRIGVLVRAMPIKVEEPDPAPEEPVLEDPKLGQPASTAPPYLTNFPPTQ